VAPLGDAARRQALLLARALRAFVPACVDLSGRGLKAQMRGADRAAARVAVILGEAEMEAGAAMVRDLKSGEQQQAAWPAVPAAVRRILDQTDGGS
jgi:histidyl-tRNA synthetase